MPVFTPLKAKIFSDAKKKNKTCRIAGFTILCYYFGNYNLQSFSGVVELFILSTLPAINF